MEPIDEHRRMAREYRWRAAGPEYANYSPLTNFSPLLASDPEQSQFDKAALLIAHHSPEIVQDVKSFWSKLIQHHGFGFTLFAGKPISSAEFFGPHAGILEDATEADLQHNEACFPSVKECMSWRRLRQGYHPANFFINESPDGAQGMRLLTIVNREAVRGAFRLQEKRFQEVYGKSLTAENLLSRLQVPDRPIDALEQHHDLCGILFGLDTASSALYQRAMQLQVTPSRSPSGDLSRIARTDIPPSPGYFNTQEELHELYRMIALDPQALSISAQSPVRGVQFWGIQNSDAVDKLRQEYAQIQEQLSRLVREDELFLHKVLLQYFHLS